MDLPTLIKKDAPHLAKVLASNSPVRYSLVELLSYIYDASFGDEEDLVQKIIKDPNHPRMIHSFAQEHGALIRYALTHDGELCNVPMEEYKPIDTHTWIVSTLAIITTIGFFGLILLLTFSNPSETMKDIFFMLCGQSAAALMLVLSYYFGSMDRPTKADNSNMNEHY